MKIYLHVFFIAWIVYSLIMIYMAFKTDIADKHFDAARKLFVYRWFMYLRLIPRSLERYQVWYKLSTIMLLTCAVVTYSIWILLGASH